MTKPVDPNILATIEALRQAGVIPDKDALKAEIKAEMREAADGPPPGQSVPGWGEPLGETAADFERVVLQAPKGTDLARGDVKSARSAIRIIVSLTFEFDSEWSEVDPAGRPRLRLGQVPGNRVTTLMVRAFMRQLMLTSKRVRKFNPETKKAEYVDTNKPLSSGYRNRIYAILRTLLNFRYADRAPALKIKGERGGTRTGCFQGERHLAQFLEHTPPFFRKIAWLAVDRGCMRLKEALHLEKSEVHLDDPSGPRIVLPAHRVKGGKKKKPKGRSFPISDENAAMLRAQMAASTSPIYVFAKPNGKPYSTTYAQDIMSEAARKSGIRLGKYMEAPCFHHFRRTAVTWRLAKARYTPGGSPTAELKSAQEEGGWDSIKILSGYLDEIDSMAAESARMANVKLDDVMAARLADLEAQAPREAVTPPPPPPVPTTPTVVIRRPPKKAAKASAAAKTGRAVRRR